MKKFSWTLSVFYLVFVYGWIGFDIFLFSQMKTESDIHIPVLIVVLVNILFFMALIILLIVQSINIISATRNKNINYCINSYLFYKYTATPIILTTIFISIYVMLGVMIITPIAFIMPMVLIILPLLLGIAFIVLPILWIFAIMADIPSFIAAVCILVLTKSENRISFGKCVLHFILQIIPVIDIIDGLYISIKYWKRGKIAAVITAFCVIVGIAVYFTGTGGTGIVR